MFNAGWRKAYTHNGILGISASVPKISGHEERYLELQEGMKPQEKFLATRFAHLSRLLYDTLQIQHKELKLPSISSNSFSELHDFSFASHLSFTLNNFHNKPHCDQDSSTYSFGLWLPIYSRDGQLITKDFNVKGGNFIFPEDNFGLKFEGFDGIVKMVWKADKFSHKTEPSVSNSYHNRLGLSCEIPSTSLQTVARLQQNFYDSNPDAFFLWYKPNYPKL
ncbi:hypothetical protein PGT21_016256 [Puccinia graminis f. sp. tritici]|uniref:Tet-like 2OG-Fe(II) oxygenase domain-containing protein n=1 Tax=Puccinia graminis f. sp. tritici TaxID=56615 RepID=A0A5B0QT59_PUCGR|nr:hypothetical protein PGT21_016256 [Puccinia graminis f. sp. tritici]